MARHHATSKWEGWNSHSGFLTLSMVLIPLFPWLSHLKRGTNPLGKTFETQIQAPPPPPSIFDAEDLG